MPVTINKNKVKFKDPNNQGYISFDAIAGETSAQLVASLNARAEEIKNGNWPATSQELTTKVNDLVKIQNNEPATTSTTQVWVNPTATTTAIPTYAEFTELKNAVERNFTINATLSSPLSIGGGWVDITLDKTNAEILAAAPLGRTVINIPFAGQTITCRQTSYTNNSVFFNGMMIDSAIYVFAVTIMQSTAQASLIGTMAGPQ